MTFQLSYFSHTIMICVYVEIKKGEHFCSPFVRMTGLEPTRRKTLDPKSSAATNYATPAGPYWDCKGRTIFYNCKF